MAKTIWICSRKELPRDTEHKMHSVCDKITPDNITPIPHKVVTNTNVAYGITNPQDTLIIKDNSLMLGMLFEEADNWHIPGEKHPDGSYAIIRNNDDFCELVTDAVASRTIWYYKNDDLFVASTSQRAIILFIGGFDFNQRVIPWMLATGCIGPQYSWDKRINMVPPDSAVTLNKHDWSIQTKQNPIVFEEVKKDNKFHEEKLKQTMESTFNSIDFNFSDWVLPLSGGYDSRGILCFLKQKGKTDNLKTVTWGLKSSLKQRKNDAYIAKKLADTFNVSHQYFYTNLSDEPTEKILHRFLINGEGRLDNFAAYMDGFYIWKALFESGVKGIIRGDEGFGGKEVSSTLTARLYPGLGLCSDYSNLKEYRKYNIPEQEIPDDLLQRENESLKQWADRLNHEFHQPVSLAALSDLKLSYVEIANPLLSKKILLQARKLPDHLRNNKTLYKKIVKSMSPKVPFATRHAEALLPNSVKQKRIVDLIKKELESDFAKEIFSEEFLNQIIKNLKIADDQKSNEAKPFSIKLLLKQILPVSIKNYLKDRASSKLSIDYNLLGFRTFIVLKMNKLLKEQI
ncbi:MAG: hypothetical protein PWQ06_582 [Anaerophaga sp.]|nr:hypothetical protein [Anaerophaga sp.]